MKRAILAAILRVEAKLGRLLTLEEKMSAELDALTAQVKANTDAEQSAVVLLGGLKKALDDAIATGNPAALTKLSSDLGASQQNLAAAILANTPASP